MVQCAKFGHILFNEIYNISNEIYNISLYFLGFDNFTILAKMGNQNSFPAKYILITLFHRSNLINSSNLDNKHHSEIHY